MITEKEIEKRIDDAIDDIFHDEGISIKNNPNKDRFVKQMHLQYYKLYNDPRTLHMTNDHFQNAINIAIRDFVKMHGDLFKKQRKWKNH